MTATLSEFSISEFIKYLEVKDELPVLFEKRTAWDWLEIKHYQGEYIVCNQKVGENDIGFPSLAEAKHYIMDRY